MTNKELTQQLTEEVQQLIDTIEAINDLNEEVLCAQPQQNKWSLAQIVEHLNTYNRYYIPLISNALQQIREERVLPVVKSGFLGGYFIKTMYAEVVTRGEVPNKMKTVKKHHPGNTLDVNAVLSEFLRAEDQLLGLIGKIGNKDLSRVKVPITLSKYIKISVGDALRFLIAHQIRHRLQIQDTLSVVAQPVPL